MQSDREKVRCAVCLGIHIQLCCIACRREQCLAVSGADKNISQEDLRNLMIKVIYFIHIDGRNVVFTWVSPKKSTPLSSRLSWANTRERREPSEPVSTWYCPSVPWEHALPPVHQWSVAAMRSSNGFGTKGP